jgi:quinone-modifying oxidoreductase subunit QmoC
MLATSRGLKDRLIGNSEIWLCRNCGDCSTLCPMGSMPADVLAFVRSYAVSDAAPKALGAVVNTPGMLPILPSIPAVLFIIVGLLANVVPLGWLNFSPTGEHLWGSNYFKNLLCLVFGLASPDC